jgi:prepilin-type N-terminal cleavage/methylation domain-containing protein
MRNTRPSQKRRKDAGFTMIELLIASVVLVIGVMAMAGLVGLGVKNNGHSRLDSTGVMLNQAVVEQVSEAIIYEYNSCGGTGVATITDCANNTFHPNGNGPGALLYTSITAPAVNQIGNIDFTASAIPGYQMNYTICNGSTQVVYDVRWNISNMSSLGPTTDTASHTNVLTVGTRLQGGTGGIINFPINMRVLLGPDPPVSQAAKCQ